MNEPNSVKNIDLGGKNVLLRADLEWPAENCLREKVFNRIIDFLKSQNVSSIKVIGHKGKTIEDIRNDPREEKNDISLAQELANGFDVYINEAFATSHRKHCSIDALPRFMRSQGKVVGMGLRFEEELKNLKEVNYANNKTIIIGGAKGDKENYANVLEKQGWNVLRGGLLSGVDLRTDRLDVSDALIEKYIQQIANSKTIVVAGPVGKYEEAEKGTREIFTAVANSNAFKVAGGGDTESALSKFGLTEKFDWISVGGGAMLEYLATGTLPGIEALIG